MSVRFYATIANLLPVQLSERVIVDHDGYEKFSVDEFVFGGPDEDEGVLSIFNPMLEALFGNGTVEGTRFDGIYSNYDSCPPEREFEGLQAQICPSTVYVYSLSARKWFRVAVSYLKKVNWNRTAFKQLVLEDETKELLKGLVGVHKENRNQGRIMRDIIPTKGQVRFISDMHR